MASTRVAQRYAKALMELAKEEGSFDIVVEDIRTISAAIEGSNDLRNMLRSPIIDDRTKESILRAVFGGKIGTIADRFVSLLTLKGRSPQLADIITAFNHLLDKEQNTVQATITTAVDLDPAQKQKLEERISTLSGHNVRATYVIDPSIIGGFRARFEDRMIDASVRHQLDRLRESFVEGSLTW